MKYRVLRTDTADSQLRNIILYIMERFGLDVDLAQLEKDYPLTIRKVGR